MCIWLTSTFATISIFFLSRLLLFKIVFCLFLSRIRLIIGKVRQFVFQVLKYNFEQQDALWKQFLWSFNETQMWTMKFELILSISSPLSWYLSSLVEMLWSSWNGCDFCGLIASITYNCVKDYSMLQWCWRGFTRSHFVSVMFDNAA